MLPSNHFYQIVYMFLFSVLLVSCSGNKQQQEPLESTPEPQPLFTAALGIQPYSFRNSFPNGVAETLDTIQNMGFTEVEGKNGDIDPETYKQLCDERGLSIPAMGTSYDNLVNHTQSVIDEAKIYGSKYIMVAWIPHESDDFTLDDANRAIEDFNRAGKILHENGLTFCYHVHGYEFQPHEDGTLMDYMMEQTNAQYVSYEMDVFWVHFGGADPVALMQKYPDRWKLMHLKDMKQGIPKDLTGHTDVEHNVPLGTGEVDIEGVLRAAKEAGVVHYFIEDESSRIITQIPQSIAYLKSLNE